MKVANWDTWQTFRKDRGTPPWIKVYRNLLTNEEWADLSDSEKGHLVSIWIIAADKGGQIPDSPKKIQKMAMLDSQPNINKFIKLGFLVSDCQPDGNQMATEGEKNDAKLTNQSRDREETDESRVDSGGKAQPPKKFNPPSVDEVRKYCNERNNNVDPNSFVDHYAANGWMRGKTKVKDWKACVRTWEKGSHAESRKTETIPERAKRLARERGYL